MSSTKFIPKGQMKQDLDVVDLLAGRLQSFRSKPAENKGMLPNSPYLLACGKLMKKLMLIRLLYVMSL